MKKNILYLILLIFASSGCKKDGLVKYDIEKSFADPQIALDDLKKQVTAGADGFSVILEPVSGGIIGGYIALGTSADAKFVVDNNVSNATTPQSTSFNLKLSQKNAVLALGSTGPFATFASTVKVDTNYTYKSNNGDTLKFVGDATGTKLRLIKASKNDATEYLAGKMGVNVAALAAIKTFPRYFKRLTVSSKIYDLTFNSATKILTFDYGVGTAPASFSSIYYCTNSGVVLKTPFVDGTVTIGEFRSFVLNLTTSSGTAKINGVDATITNEAAPSFVDLTAARTFYNNPPNGSYWTSSTGFTVEAVEDGYKLKSIPSFSFLLFYPKYNVAYSRLGFIVNGAYGAYGPAEVASFPANGTIKFTNAGSFGTAPANIATVVNATANKFLDASGFYVIKTGATSYDLVSALDGKAWINWGP